MNLKKLPPFFFLLFTLSSILLFQSCAPKELYDLIQEEYPPDSITLEETPQSAESGKPGSGSLETFPIEQISEEKYAYRQLGSSTRQIYDEMLTAILHQEEKIHLSTTDLEVMQEAYAAICADYGGLFWVNGYVYTQYTQGEELVSLEFSPKYTMEEAERTQVQAQIDEVAGQWLEGISMQDSSYDKIKHVYDQLAQNVEYVPGAQDSQNIISVFLRNQTVCQGYACAVQYLLERLGIQSVIVSGTARGESHAWNLVALEDGYYYMDVTWGNTKYLDKEGGETPYIDYKYLAMTTDEMEIEHVPDGALELPECTAVANNYFHKEGNYIVQWEPDRIGQKLAQAWEQGESITLRFSEKALMEQVFQYFVTESHVADYCNGLTKINFIQDDEWNEIRFVFI